MTDIQLTYPSRQHASRDVVETRQSKRRAAEQEKRHRPSTAVSERERERERHKRQSGLLRHIGIALTGVIERGREITQCEQGKKAAHGERGLKNAPDTHTQQQHSQQKQHHDDGLPWSAGLGGVDHDLGIRCVSALWVAGCGFQVFVGATVQRVFMICTVRLHPTAVV